MRQRPALFDLDAGGHEDVVDRALGPPARERRRRLLGRREARARVEHLELGAVRGRVEIAHQHCVPLRAEQFGEEGDLARARLRAEREVRDDDDERVIAVAEAHPQRAAPGNASGQRIVEHFARLVAREQAVARGRELGHAPVRLVSPIRELRSLREVLRLVEEARAQAAGVGFLQCDEVEVAEQARELIEILALAVRQHVLPAVRDVVAIALDAAAGEDVAAEQRQRAVRVGGGLLGSGRCARHAGRLIRRRGAGKRRRAEAFIFSRAWPAWPWRRVPSSPASRRVRSSADSRPRTRR